MDIFSTSILLFIIMDPLGNLPVFISMLKNVPADQRNKVLLRELIIALFILLMFVALGESILSFLSLQQEAVSISGGIVMFLIAIKMVFPTRKHGDSGANDFDDEPFIVPLAVPLIAGPSILATLILMSKQHPDSILILVGSISLAWLATLVILLFSGSIIKLVGLKGLRAMERLMGMVLIMISVQMLLNGLKSLQHSMT